MLQPNTRLATVQLQGVRIAQTDHRPRYRPRDGALRQRHPLQPRLRRLRRGLPVAGGGPSTAGARDAAGSPVQARKEWLEGVCRGGGFVMLGTAGEVT